MVLAVSDVEAVKPDREDLDFLTFLSLARQNERGELEGRLAHPGYIDDITYFPRHRLEGLDPKQFWQGSSGPARWGTGPFVSPVTSLRDGVFTAR